MKKIFCFFIMIFIFFINFNVYANEKYTVKLSKCVDGDTARFILKKEEIKARFLAINTPESVHPTKEVESFGKESSDFTCKKLTKAKKIEIEYDSASDKTDKYGRHLVWVYVDSVLLQKTLVEKGYAKVDYLYGKYEYVDILKKAEEKAKNKSIGVWSIEEEKDETVKKNTTLEVDEFSDLKGLLTSTFEIVKKFVDLLEKIVNAVL